MTTSTTPFYLDPAFWAVIVSITAIVLSQIPPLRLLFKKAILEIELYSRIHITHKIGNPNLRCHVVLNNTGGKKLRVKNISAKIERDGKIVASMPAQNYETETGNTGSNRILTNFTIDPENEWGKNVHFLNYFDRKEEKLYKEAENLIKNDIYEKFDKKETENEKKDKKSLITAEEKNVQPFLDMFDRMFVWEPGEYQLIIKVSADPLKKEVEKHFRFTLFETDSNNLRKYTDDYIHGIGIFIESLEKHPGVNIEVTEVV